MKHRLGLALLCLALSTGCAAIHESFLRHKAQSGSGPMVQGLQQGTWTYRYLNEGRTLRAKGRFQADRQVGPWTYWHDNEVVEWEGHFQDNKLGGLQRFYWRDGRDRAQGFYSGGKKQGLWRFWNSDGRLAQQGSYLGDQRSLRWTYFHPDGSMAAEGYRAGGKEIGLWRFRGRDGSTFEKRFPVPAGLEIVRDTFPSGTVRREGYLRGGRAEGLWVTYNQDGTPQLVASYVNGVLEGNVQAYDAEGAPVVAGWIEDSKPVGSFTVWQDGQSSSARVGALPSPLPEGVEPATPLEHLATGLASLAEPAAPHAFATTGSPEPDPATLGAIASPPRVPIRHQPWTVRESERIDDILEMYTVGVQSGPKRRGVEGGGGYAGALPVSERRNATKSDPMLGKPLPHTALYSVEGEPLDLGNLKGKRVMMVILRGFDGQVCVYCATQVRALQLWDEDYQDAFAVRNTEIVIVYPGSRDDLLAFQEAYQEESEGEPIPFTVAYDPGFEMVDSLKIRGSLAIPTTVILDEKGTVRYAYVGNDEKIDRPSAKDLTAFLDQM